MKSHIWRSLCRLTSKNAGQRNLIRVQDGICFRLDCQAGMCSSNPYQPLYDQWRKTLPGSTVFRSPHHDSEVPKVTYPLFALSQMEKFGDKTFLINGKTGEKSSFSGSLREICRVASALIRLGCKPGDRLGFYSFNRLEYVHSWFAATAIGCVAVDVNPTFTPAELEIQLRNTNTKFLFVHPSIVENAKEAAAKLGTIQKIVVFGEAEGVLPYSELKKDGGDLFSAPIEAGVKDILHLPASSGTTGLPKSVSRSHRNLLGSCWATNHPDLLLFENDDIGLILLPLFHMYANFLLGCALVTGTTIVLQERFIPEETLGAIQQFKVSTFPLVPPLMLFLAHHPLVDKYDLSCLKEVFCGAAPVSVEVVEAVLNRLKVDHVGQGYGMTEMCPISVRPHSGGPYDSCGVLVLNTQIKVKCLDSGKELHVGQHGEIWARGPHIMTNYEDNVEATESTIVDGWLKTGDIGYMSSDGYVYIVDRLKDFIKVKAHQVAPAELEALLLTHPSVQDVAVIGVAHPWSGEAPRAFVVLKDKDCKPEKLCHFVAERSSPEKHLTGGVIVLDQIPKSASGKILKKELRIMNAKY